MIRFLSDFLSLLLIPLSFLPSSILAFFGVTISFFSLFVVAKVIRWLLDLIPGA